MGVVRGYSGCYDGEAFNSVRWSITNRRGSQPESSKRQKLAYCGAAKYPSKFKSESTNSYPIKPVQNDQHSFFRIPCNKTISCRHQGIKDVKDHCATDTHKRLLRTATSQPSVSKFFQESSTSEEVIKVTQLTFLCSITYPWQQLIIWAPYSKPFSLIAKLPRDTHVGKQRQLPSSTRLWGQTVMTILSSIVKLTLSVWASMGRVILTWTKWTQWLWEFWCQQVENGYVPLRRVWQVVEMQQNQTLFQTVESKLEKDEIP